MYIHTRKNFSLHKIRRRYYKVDVVPSFLNDSLVVGAFYLQNFQSNCGKLLYILFEFSVSGSLSQFLFVDRIGGHQIDHI
jgi:hypothetical protein